MRYKHSVIGFMWGFVKPLIYLLIFIIIFGSQFSSTSRYVLYATSGIIFWFFFSNIIVQSIQSIIQSAGIIKSVKLNLLVFPLAELITELFNLLLAMCVFFSIMHWFDLHYSFQLLWILPSLILFSVFSFGISIMLAALNVYFRDIGILWNTIQPAIFYLTPIAYTEEFIPIKFAFVIKLNPIYPFIKLLRQPIYSQQPIDFSLMLQCSLLSCISLLCGIFIFNKLKNQFISAL